MMPFEIAESQKEAADPLAASHGTSGLANSNLFVDNRHQLFDGIS